MSAAPSLSDLAAFPPALSGAVREAATAFFVAYCGFDAVERPQATAAPCAGVVGMISFIGNPNWAFALVLPEPTAVAASKAFAGFDIPFDSPDMADVIGEMANVMAGDISARLESRGMKAQMSLPTVARGHDVELLYPSGSPAVQLGFTSPSGEFWFKLVRARPGGSFFSRRPGA